MARIFGEGAYAEAMRTAQRFSRRGDKIGEAQWIKIAARIKD